MEKCNKKIGRKRRTKEKVKAVKQMSLVKQGSKDKGREGGMGRGGGGHLGRGRARVRVRKREEREREKGTEEKKGIKGINRGEGEKDVY